LGVKSGYPQAWETFGSPEGMFLYRCIFQPSSPPQKPSKPAVHSAEAAASLQLDRKIWSSGGNRIPTFAGRRETRLGGWGIFQWRAGALSRPRGARLFRVSRGAHQLAVKTILPARRHLALEAGARAPQPKGPRDLDTDGANRRAVAAARQGSTSASAAPLHRQTPEVGAECVGSARSDPS